jgi:SAM-dependent methyltransferase
MPCDSPRSTRLCAIFGRAHVSLKSVLEQDSRRRKSHGAALPSMLLKFPLRIIADHGFTRSPTTTVSIFDIVFSSNVLEHVPNLSQLNQEISRVLKANGYCIHVMPTHSWRFWTTISSFPAVAQYLRSPRGPALPSTNVQAQARAGIWQKLRRHFGRHGERGNVVSELWLFHPSWWRRAFRRDGFDIVCDEPIGIFYTGNTVFGTSVFSVERRRWLSQILGSACHLYKVKPIRAD